MKANKRNAMSLFKAELRRQAEDEVHTLRELNTEEVRMFREQNTRSRAELRAEVTPEERIQVQEMNATHQTATRTRRALQFVDTAIDDLRFSQEQVHRHHLPPMEEISQFCQAVKWTAASANSCCRSGNLCSQLYIILH